MFDSHLGCYLRGGVLEIWKENQFMVTVDTASGKIKLFELNDGVEDRFEGEYATLAEAISVGQSWT